MGGKLTEFITQINNCYPPEVVEYYSPSYSKTLLDKIDEYVVRTNTHSQSLTRGNTHSLVSPT